jgi:Domain of unknown function (DUF4386)
MATTTLETRATPTRDRAPERSYRTTVRVVGAVYLGGFVVGIAGNILIQSVLGAPQPLAIVAEKSTLLAIGALLWLMAVAGDAAHGVLMFQMLKKYHSERIAFGYLAARIVDAIFIAVWVLFTLIQVPLGSEYVKAAASDALSLNTLSTVAVQASQYAYDIGMIALGLAGLMLCYTLYRAKLVPRILALWGLIGYAIIFCGMASEVMGSGLGLASSLPGGLWEVFIGAWLIIRGFNSPTIVSPSGTSSRW